MIYQICAVYDNQAKAFIKPLFVRANGEAIRGFMDEANRADPQNTLYNYPEDFHLSHLGTWDDETGKFNQQEQSILMQGRNAKKSV